MSHSLTIQIDPNLPGHVAVSVNTPDGQTHAGFGPQRRLSPISPGKFDAHTIKPGEDLPSDYSNTGLGPYGTFTVPVSEGQANAALAEIARINRSGMGYNFFDSRTCATVANQIMRAAELGNPLYAIPQVNFEFLSDVADTLANDPRAKVARRTGVSIPDSLRGLQQDYAYVGGGYDTPSERLRFGPASWEASRDQQPDQAPDVSAPRPIRYLSGRHAADNGAQLQNRAPFSEGAVSNDGADFDERFLSGASSWRETAGPPAAMRPRAQTSAATAIQDYIRFLNEQDAMASP